MAHILRDAGYEVIYTGIRRTPEQIVATAIQEDVKLIGISLLSGAHLVLFKRILDLLRQHAAEDIIVVGGGTIPAQDIPALEAMGVAAVFTARASGEVIVQTIGALLENPRARA